MSTTLSTLSTLNGLRAGGTTRLADIAPVTGTQPPGTEGVMTLLGYVLWGVTIAGVLGVMICAGKMNINHRRGEAAEAAGALGWVMAGCILAGSASALVNVFL